MNIKTLNELQPLITTIIEVEKMIKKDSDNKDLKNQYNKLHKKIGELISKL